MQPSGQAITSDAIPGDGVGIRPGITIVTVGTVDGMTPGTMAITTPSIMATMAGVILGIMAGMAITIPGITAITIPGVMATMATTTWAIPIIQRFTMAVHPVAIPLIQAIRVRSIVTVVLMAILPETDQRLLAHIHPV